MLGALFLLGALGFGFSLTRPSASAPSRADALVALADRKAAPSLGGGQVLVGPPLSLARYRGRVLFVNFWASWCVPCRKEAPELARFADSLDSRKAAIIGVDINDKRPDALRFIHHFGLRYANSADPNLTVFHRYGVVGIPTTFVIDARSQIAARLLGPQTERSLSALLSRVLDETRP
jgi:thiol-disulfide isomerase/thioredoxin